MTKAQRQSQQWLERYAYYIEYAKELREAATVDEKELASVDAYIKELQADLAKIIEKAQII